MPQIYTRSLPMGTLSMYTGIVPSCTTNVLHVPTCTALVLLTCTACTTRQYSCTANPTYLYRIVPYVPQGSTYVPDVPLMQYTSPKSLTLHEVLHNRNRNLLNGHDTRHETSVTSGKHSCNSCKVCNYCPQHPNPSVSVP
jgi:hypothetical protein